MIGEALRVAPGQTLRGRQNVMWRPGGEVLAQIVEILPPLESVCPERHAECHTGRHMRGCPQGRCSQGS